MIILEIMKFFLRRKKYWLLPVIIVLSILGGLVVFTQGSVVAPMIYTMF